MQLYNKVKLTGVWFVIISVYVWDGEWLMSSLRCENLSYNNISYKSIHYIFSIYFNIHANVII